MMLNRYAIYWVVAHMVAIAMLWAALATMSSGCSKKATKIEIATEPTQKNGASVTEIEPEQKIVMREGKPASGALLATVYFDFDDARLKPEEMKKLERLVLDRKIPVRIEGHTCKYGTNEYNIGLGHKRAVVVAKYLGRGTAISWGEEKCQAECATIDEQECRECRKAEVYAE